MPDPEAVKLESDRKLEREIDGLREELIAVKRDLISSLDDAIRAAESAVTADDALVGKGMLAPNAKERGDHLERVVRLKKQRLDIKTELLEALKTKLKRQSKRVKKTGR